MAVKSILEEPKSKPVSLELRFHYRDQEQPRSFKRALDPSGTRELLRELERERVLQVELPPPPEVECELEGYRGDIARCWVEISGTRLPVDFPAAVLSQLGLAEGSRFLWKSGQGEVSTADIKIMQAEEFRPDEELLKAFDEFRRERESGFWAESSED